MSTSIATPATDTYSFFDVRVVRTERLSPSLVRVTFGGEQLRDFASGGRDQCFSLFLPHPGQPEPVLPRDAGPDWYAQWRAMDPEVRAVMRSYTVRAQHPGADEVAVDFVLHGDVGPASRWAGRAAAGDTAVLLGPVIPENKGICWHPPERTDWVLMAADETALPAVCGILDQLPAGTRAKVWITVPDAADRRELARNPEVEVVWLVHGGRGSRRSEPLLDAVRATRFPAGRPYAWLAGEAGGVRTMRRHLLDERGFDRRSVTFVGYWRLGATEEELRAQATADAERDD